MIYKGKQQMTASMPPELYNYLIDKAKENDLELKELLEIIVGKYAKSIVEKVVEYDLSKEN